MNKNFPRGHNAFMYTDENGATAYDLHNSKIAKIANGQVFLNHCGYKTNTTKTHMNDFLAHIGSNFKVVQEDFSWYVWNYVTGEKFEMQSGWNEVK